MKDQIFLFRSGESQSVQWWWPEVTSLVSVIFPHGPLALSLVFPGPVSLLALLAAVGRVPAAPVYRLGLALVTLNISVSLLDIVTIPSTHPLLLLVLRDRLPVFLHDVLHLGDVVRPTPLKVPFQAPAIYVQ